MYNEVAFLALGKLDPVQLDGNAAMLQWNG